MSTEALSSDIIKKLQELQETTPLSTLAKKWKINRRTLAEAFAGYPTRYATRFLIETKVKELAG